MSPASNSRNGTYSPNGTGWVLMYICVGPASGSQTMPTFHTPVGLPGTEITAPTRIGRADGPRRGGDRRRRRDASANGSMSEEFSGHRTKSGCGAVPGVDGGRQVERLRARGCRARPDGRPSRPCRPAACRPAPGRPSPSRRPRPRRPRSGRGRAAGSRSPRRRRSTSPGECRRAGGRAQRQRRGDERGPDEGHGERHERRAAGGRPAAEGAVGLREGQVPPGEAAEGHARPQGLVEHPQRRPPTPGRPAAG